VQQVAQLLAFRLLKLWGSCLRAGRFLLKTSQSCGFQNANPSADRLVTTASLPGTLARRFALGAQKKKLASSACEGLGSPQSCTQSRTLGACQRTDEERFFHTAYLLTNNCYPNTSFGDALGAFAPAFGDHDPSASTLAASSDWRRPAVD